MIEVVIDVAIDAVIDTNKKVEMCVSLITNLYTYMQGVLVLLYYVIGRRSRLSKLPLHMKR